MAPCRLFLEKIRRHPDFAQAPAPDKARVKKVRSCQCHYTCVCVHACAEAFLPLPPQLLKAVLPRAEELKEKLTDLQQAKINAVLKKKAEVHCWCTSQRCWVEWLSVSSALCSLQAEEARAKEEEARKQQLALMAGSSGLPAVFAAVGAPVQSHDAPYGSGPLPTPHGLQHPPTQTVVSCRCPEGRRMVAPPPPYCSMCLTCVCTAGVKHKFGCGRTPPISPAHCRGVGNSPPCRAPQQNTSLLPKSL